jgi:hypothetical protein
MQRFLGDLPSCLTLVPTCHFLSWRYDRATAHLLRAGGISTLQEEASGQAGYVQLSLLGEEQASYITSQDKGDNLTTYTKETLVAALQEIRDKGWIPNSRPGNAEGVGNTLEDLLEIEENNLPLPNAAEWELKCQRANTSSLVTLFHLEPSPRAMRLVPQMLLPLYGWEHQEAGAKYGIDEKSFRQTISGQQRSDRGFKVVVDRGERKVVISFDAAAADPRHKTWLDSVKERVGLEELNPQPYWGFDDLFHKAGTKLLNCFFVEAEVKKQAGQEYFRYSVIKILQSFSLDGLLSGLEHGYMYVDFDARTGHNHGTKFRLRRSSLPLLYEHRMEV